MTRWRKVRSVALFEFLCTIRSKSYLIITFGMPVFVLLYGGLVSIPVYLAERKENEVAVYGVVDEAGVLGMTQDVSQPAVEIPEEIRTALRATGQQDVLDRQLAFWKNFVFRPFATEEPARAALKGKRIRGYFRIPSDYVESGIVETYVSDGGADLGGSETRRALSSLLTSRLLQGKLPDALVERVKKPIAETRTWNITATGEVKKGGGVGNAVRVIVPIAFAVLLLMSILMSAGTLIQATAVEKENKVVEVLLSSANPDEILIGKLLGLGATGVLQMTVWFGMVAVAGLALTGTLATLGIEPPWIGMAGALLFFPLAYLFFGSLMLGTGAVGSNQKEANQWGMVWSLLLVVPMVFLEAMLREPHGVAARVLTWIPFATPITVVFRLTMDPGGVAWWEVVGPMLVLVASTWFAIRVGARLFRVGILLTGSRPKLREILRQARLS